MKIIAAGLTTQLRRGDRVGKNKNLLKFRRQKFWFCCHGGTKAFLLDFTCIKRVEKAVRSLGPFAKQRSLSIENVDVPQRFEKLSADATKSSELETFCQYGKRSSIQNRGCPAYKYRHAICIYSHNKQFGHQSGKAV